MDGGSSRRRSFGRGSGGTGRDEPAALRTRIRGGSGDNASTFRRAPACGSGKKAARGIERWCRRGRCGVRLWHSGSDAAGVQTNGTCISERLSGVLHQSRALIVEEPMRTRLFTVAALAFVVSVTSVVLDARQRSAAQQSEAPRYANGSNLIRPADYREWVFLSSGLGMDYNPTPQQRDSPGFGNVFVNPSSYREFMKTGKWPDKTTFVLEFRASTSEGSINKSGRFQTQLVGLEAEVKDSKFPDGWAFFNFGRGADISGSA